MAETRKSASDDTSPATVEGLLAAAAPWLEPARLQLQSALATGRLPHALLLQAAAGSGESALGLWAAQLALCDRPHSAPCGQCGACVLFLAGNHPDFVSISFEEDAKVIKVDQIRELATRLTLKSFRGRRKVGIIDPADRMNTPAFNALLKTLEEPPAETLLVLVASRLDRLPRTVVSRCQRLRVVAPTAESATRWLAAGEARDDWATLLELAGGAPVRAQELARRGVSELASDMQSALDAAGRTTLDPLELAQAWFRDRPADRLAWLEAWTARCIIDLSVGREAARSSTSSGLPKTPAPMNIRTAFKLLDRVRTARATLESSLNTQLLFEDLLVCLSEACAGRDIGHLEP